MPRTDEQGVEEIVENLRIALTEKLNSSRELKAAFERDALANRRLTEAKQAIRDVSFDQIGDESK